MEERTEKRGGGGGEEMEVKGKTKLEIKNYSYNVYREELRGVRECLFSIHRTVGAGPAGVAATRAKFDVVRVTFAADSTKIALLCSGSGKSCLMLQYGLF